MTVNQVKYRRKDHLALTTTCLQSSAFQGKVRITETLVMTVDVEAHSRDEAEQIASDNWHNSDYILDADNFVGVEFEATEEEPRRKKNYREER